MDILIKGLALPKEGVITWLTLSHDGRVIVQGSTDGTFDSKKELAKAIPVPEHGDLIDRDALKEDAKRIQRNDTGFFIDSMSYGEALSRAVDNAPVVLERTT